MVVCVERLTGGYERRQSSVLVVEQLFQGGGLQVSYITSRTTSGGQWVPRAVLHASVA